VTPRKRVQSSNIHSVGYDEKAHEVHVEFHSGDVWKYPATAADHRAFVNAGSVGKYFHAHIKPRGGERVE
jgi:KTSC domain